jgi:hypothetical protein
MAKLLKHMLGILKMITVYPLGTTIYDPEKCYNGYTLFCFPFKQEVRLVNMNGNIINQWDVQAIRAKLLKTGNLIVVERRRGERNRVLEYSWEGSLNWEYEPPGPAHHDVEKLENGNTLLLCLDPVPEEYKKSINDPKRRSVSQIFSDLVLEVTPDKKVVWDWHMYEHLDINKYCKICKATDWTHTNTIQSLPNNRHYDAGDERFKPGNILLSPRNLSYIFIVDKDTKNIVWEYSGKFTGGLAGQHEPHMIEKGLPGEGNIIIFDNGAPPIKETSQSLEHTGKSYILEIDPATEELVWKYENGEKFYSAFRSSVQRVPNGNTLICESEGSRIFEVTRAGEIVWEYAVEWNNIIGRAYRYPYNYCRQLATMGNPKEKMVKPPIYIKTYPQDWETDLRSARAIYSSMPTNYW